MLGRTHTGTVVAEKNNNHDRPPRTFSSGRVCAEPGCDTCLSVYNSRPYCSLHLLGVAPRLRGNKVA